MSKLETLLKQLCPNGVEYRKLGDVGQFTRGNGLQKKDFTDSGVGCIHYGQIYTHYGLYAYETKSFVSKEFAKKLRRAKTGDLVIATTSENDEDVCKAVAWLGDDEVAVSGDAFIYSHSLEPKYVSYFFQSEHFQAQKMPHITGTKVRRVNGNAMEKLLMPVPPIKIQEEVVRILDAFSSLKAELEAELEARIKQYEHYRDQLVTFSDKEVELKSLGSIFEINTGQKPSIILAENAGFDYVNAGTTRSGYCERSNCEGDTVTTPSRGQGGIGYVGYQKEPFWLGPLCYKLRSIDNAFVINKYLFYFLQSKSKLLLGLKKEGGVPAVNKSDLAKLEIPVPSLNKQKHIVAILNKFDALVYGMKDGLPAEIKARRQQYEHYRDQLFKFKEISR